MNYLFSNNSIKFVRFIIFKLVTFIENPEIGQICSALHFSLFRYKFTFSFNLFICTI